MRSRSWLVLSSVLAIAATTGDAYADGDAEGAKKHFEAGRKLRDEGDCTRAITEFEQSLVADKSIGAFYNLGFCQEQLGHRPEALEAYRRARELASAKKDERLKEISGALAALLETPHVRLVLPQPLPAGTQVYVDGELVPATYYATETVVFTKAAATHEVLVTAPGYDDVALRLETRELKSVELHPGNAKKPPPTKPEVRKHWSRQHWIGTGLIAGGALFTTIGGLMFLSYKLDEKTLHEKVVNAAKACTGGEEGCKRMPTTNTGMAYSKAVADYNTNEQDVRDRAPLIGGFAFGGIAMMGVGVFLYLTADPVIEEVPARAAENTPRLRDLQLTPVLGADVQGFALGGSF